MKIVGVVQARMGSTRLPGKVLKRIDQKPMLQVLLERLATSRLLDKTYVATTIEKQDDEIVALCESLGCAVYRGSELDTLSRFNDILNLENAKTIVRLTGDNPLVNGELVDIAIKEFNDLGVDYLNTLDNSLFPKGLTVEVLDKKCVQEAVKSDSLLDREHVTKFVRDRPHLFEVSFLRGSIIFPDVELTVDTPADFKKIKLIFQLLAGSEHQSSIQALANVCWKNIERIKIFEKGR